MSNLHAKSACCDSDVEVFAAKKAVLCFYLKSHKKAKTPVTKLKTTNNPDGRRQRSERSKRAIIDACAKLVKDGVLVPTAQMISDQAEVPIRSFFRHFPDMQSLFKAMDEELQETYRGTLSRDVPLGTLQERIDASIDIQAKSFEAVQGIIDSTKAQLWRYKILRENYARWQKSIRADRLRCLPELSELDSTTFELIDGIASYEMWSRLRHHQKLSIRKSSQVIKDIIWQLANKT